MRIAVSLLAVLRLVLDGGLHAGAAASLLPFAPQPFSAWSERRPMGWNSYDAYHAAITERQFKAAVDVLATRLRPLRVPVTSRSLISATNPRP